MSEARETRGRMSVEAFFEWQARQDRNYELVDGIPVLPAKAMTGASRRHDIVTVNVLRMLATKLRGSSCRAHTDDLSVVNPNGAVRRPDVVVDCKRGPDTSTRTEEPRVLVEVLSPSTMAFDRFRKVEEYKTNPSVRAILLVSTQSAEIIVWRRNETGWASEIVEGLETAVALPEIGCDLPLAEIYEDIEIARRDAP